MVTQPAPTRPAFTQPVTPQASPAPLSVPGADRTQPVETRPDRFGARPPREVAPSRPEAQAPLRAAPSGRNGADRPGPGQARPGSARPGAADQMPSSRPARGADPGRARSPGWALDSRHGRRNFYPSAGYTVPALPRGHTSLAYRDSRYYYHSGVWYRPWHSGYVVVRPPYGIVVSVLPPYYSTLWAGSAYYYYANDIYYVAAPGGYAVVAPPTGGVIATAPTVAAPSPEETGPYPEGTWYYCESADAYYPYVTECAEDWQPISAVPPELLSQLSTTPSYAQGTWYWCEAAQNHYPYVRDCPEGWRPVPASTQNPAAGQR